MRESVIRKHWRQGKPVINGWLSMPGAFSAEIMAHVGTDTLTIDLQHGLVDYQTATMMLQAISTTDVQPIVRVPWNDPAAIMKSLDAGAYGIICPMINSRAEAERFVGACRYTPQGYRSVGPIRAAIYAGRDYIQHANQTIVTFAMIETREAMRNLDDILQTPGLDAIYIGPGDLGLSLGHGAVMDPTHPDTLAAIATIARTAERHGIRKGIHTNSPAFAHRMVSEQKFDFVTLLTDANILATHGARLVGELGALRANTLPPKPLQGGDPSP
jgi:4-hydroxy-2-oxoheptanedioate aldolase